MIKTISHFIKNIGFNMIADLSTKLVNSVLILLLSHYLGVEAMGSYSVAHTFFSFGLLFSYWGFGNLLTREVAKDRQSYSKFLSNFGVIRIVFGIISIVAINMISAQLDYTQQTHQAITILSFGILANTLINLINALFIAFEELKYLSIISFTVSILRLITSFLVLQFGGSVSTVMIFYTITEYASLLISAIFASHFLNTFHFEFNFKFSLDQIARAFPFFWIAILVILDSRVEILIISLFFNETLVGYYTAMNTIIGGVSLFSEGLRNAVFPIFARYQIEAPERLGEMLLMLGKYILLITFPVTIIVFFLAEPIVFLLFDPGYGTTVSLLKIVIWSFIGYSLTVVAIRLLMVHNLEKKVVLSLFVSGTLTVVLNLLLAPQLGVSGIAIARLVTTYALLFLCLYFLDKQGYKMIDLSVLARIVAASAALFITVSFLQSANLYLSLLAGLVLFAGIIWLTRVIQPKDIKLWKDVIRAILNRSNKTEVQTKS